MRRPGHNPAQKDPILRQYELVLFREIEISHAFGISTQPRAIGLIRGKAFEGSMKAVISDVINGVGMDYCWEIAMQGSAVFNGVFELREGVSEEEFLPTLKAFTSISLR
jgi:hypothetical protein